MNPSKGTFKKRKAVAAVESDPISSKLRDIRHLIDRGRTNEALSRLDKIAARKRLSTEQLVKIRSMAGDSQFALGRFEDAIQYYRAASESARNNGEVRSWFPPALREIHALLKSHRLEEARDRALAVWQWTLDRQKVVKRLLTLTNRQLRKAGPIQVTQRPFRPSVVLTRLANIFLQEGYADHAKHYYQQAVLIAPNGSTRARMALAKIALAEDDSNTAEQYAREALQMGKFQAKTVSAWSLLITARARQGKSGLDPELYTGLELHSAPKIKARAIQVIATRLREFRDPSWQTVAESWLSSSGSDDPIVAFEIEKTLLASDKLEEASAAETAKRALRLFFHAMAGPSEMVALAKDVVQFQFYSGVENLDTASLENKARSRFGDELAERTVHSMALGAMLASRHDVGRSILLSQRPRLTVGERRWGENYWALARMDEYLGNFQEAASGYLTVAGERLTPERFKVQAFFKGMDSLVQADPDADLSGLEEQLSSVLNELNDWDTLLDAGRQLALRRSVDRPFIMALSDKVIGSAVASAKAAFEAESKPGAALRILVKLTRRLFSDFSGHTEILAFWEGMDVSKRAELWSRKSDYWEYLNLVIQSYSITGNGAAAIELADSIVNSNDPTPEGFVWVGSAMIQHYLKEDMVLNALEVSQWVATEVPTHRKAAIAHYWLGLQAMVTGAAEEATVRMRSVRQCFGGKPKLLEDWQYDGKATAALQELGVTLTESARVYEADFLLACDQKLQADKLRIPA
ncbi:MAG: hypothetical protein AAF546_07270 [Verrucomicrobiota bacterium]